MGSPVCPTRLYQKGAYLCVTSQDDLGSLLMCQTSTVVTSTSVKVQVIWLRQTEQVGVFHHSFKAEVLVRNILGKVVVTVKGKDVLLDRAELARLNKLSKKMEREEAKEKKTGREDPKKRQMGGSKGEVGGKYRGDDMCWNG